MRYNLLAHTGLSFLFAAAIFSLSSPDPARADIYRYEDEAGIIHFTDAPTDKRFKFFMRDLKKDRKLRTLIKLSKKVNPAEYESIIQRSAAR